MIRAKLLLGITILMGLLLLFGGCKPGNNETEPNLIGWIDNVLQPQGETLGQLLINSPDNNTSDKFMVTVTDKTVILNETSGEQKDAEFDSFNKGQKVEIWFSGPVMESYPAQVSAEKIIIGEDSSSTIIPPLDGGRSTIGVEISCDEFSKQQFITKEIEITYPGELVITLCSNPTTGFNWEYETIGKIVLDETAYEYIAPENTGIVGASGKAVWTFEAIERGTTELRMEYSQPWEGGIKTEWSLILTVVVE